VLLDGQLQIVGWGNLRGQSPALSYTVWTQLATLEGGGWGDREPMPVVVPATLGVDRGIWFGISEGVRGLVVRDEQEQAVVYVLCEPASHYYKVMTRSDWIPVLVEERI